MGLISLLTGVFCGCGAVGATPSEWVFMNGTSRAIAHLYIAPTRGDANPEGTDLLADHAPMRHDDMIIVPISKLGGCNEYDVLLEFALPARPIPSLHLEGIDVCDLRNELFVLRDSMVN